MKKIMATVVAAISLFGCDASDLAPSSLRTRMDSDEQDMDNNDLEDMKAKEEKLAKGMYVPDDDYEKKESPEKPKDTEDLLANYEDDAYSYESTHGLPSGWADWMIKNIYYFDEAYIRGRTNPTVEIQVLYENPVPYDPPWTNEDEHLAALEEFLELTHPGWDLILSSDNEEAEVKFHLGADSSYASSSTDQIWMRYETIAAHEFAHLFGIGHHYFDVANIGDCEFCPPGEGSCIMDRNSASFGPAERFALLLDDERYDDEINEVAWSILERYPDDW